MGKLRLGAVGLGRRAGIVEIAASHPEVELVAACDTAGGASGAPARLLERLGSRGIRPAVERDYEAFLAHGLDCVLVMTPPATHAPLSVRAMEAGADVVSEIPAAYDMDQARALVDAVRRTGRRYYCAENCCYWGFVLSWKRMAREGKLGAISYVEGEYIHDLGDLLERRAPGEAGGPYASWRASLEPIRYCTHETGPLLDILDSRVTEVTAFSSPSNRRPDLPSGADLQVAIMRCASGALFKELCGFSVTRHPAFHYYVVYGSRATLETDREDLTRTLASCPEIPGLTGLASLPLPFSAAGSVPAWAGSGHGGADGAMLADFLQSILSGSPPPIDVYRGLDYTLPGICAVESIRAGSRPVSVPDPRGW
jgi:predicted dehydrogenase